MPETVANRLKPLAKKYIWWNSPEESIEKPDRVAAQVMNIGTFTAQSPG